MRYLIILFLLLVVYYLGYKNGYSQSPNFVIREIKAIKSTNIRSDNRGLPASADYSFVFGSPLKLGNKESNIFIIKTD